MWGLSVLKYDSWHFELKLYQTCISSPSKYAKCPKQLAGIWCGYTHNQMETRTDRLEQQNFSQNVFALYDLYVLK